ncbi:putative indoleamine 2,3-dioxygenase [Seiridium cardinale]|uniref:Indoleamine 2,3-dioxygenase n=1 Tax=Seiridium cardinale TaxID=138064 RepID=A0ABR2XLV2_9PEZI
MSRHTVPISATATEQDIYQFLWKVYDVTSNGFLSEVAPLLTFCNSYYQPWDDFISKLPQSLNGGTLREGAFALPLLSTDRLHSEAEWRRAYSVLAFLAHGYIWGGKQAAEVLPIAPSKPSTEVARRLDLPTVLPYAACNLWNFTSIIPVMKRALDAVGTREYDVISDALETLIICISKVGALLERMYDKCNEDVVYHQIRPYLAGSKNMEAAGLPRGVFYTTGDDGEGNWMQLRGGSNGQSSIIQFFDIVLGIQHKHEVLPSRRAATAQSGKQNLASASAEVQAIGGRGGPEADAELKGTGGTTLIPFLKQVRDETVEAGLLKA